MKQIVPEGVHITYSQSLRRCGKPRCMKCKERGAGAGHGPYWYAYWREGAKLRSAYVGKERPEILEEVKSMVESG